MANRIKQAYKKVISFLEPPKIFKSKDRKDFFTQNGHLLEIPDNIKSIQEAITVMHRNGSYYHELGFNSGKQGINYDHISNMVQMQSEKWYASLISQFSCLKEKVALSLKEKQKKLEKKEEDLKSFVQDLKHLKTKKSWNPKDFSWVEGLLYIIVSFVLILADIPLSIDFTVQAFDMVFGAKALLLSFGIAFLAIYFKYLYDKYMLTEKEKLRSQFLRESIPGVKNEHQVKKQDIQWIRFTWYLRLSVELVIGISIIVLVYSLAQIRLEGFQNLDGAISLERKNYWNQFEMVLILVTILFPVIGGVTLSIGVKKFQNIYSLRRLLKQVKEKEQIVKNQEDKLAEFTGNEKQYDMNLEWLNDTDIKTKYRAYLQSCYMEGYKNGMEEEPANGGLFDLAYRLRDRSIRVNNRK